MNPGLNNLKKIVVLTGAGISAESGISTFRDSNGLWEKYQIEDVATPAAYQKNPQEVWKFYSMRRLQAAEAHPNRAHTALVKFAELRKTDIHLITQNVDVLHQRADDNDIIPPLCMHGSLNESRCNNCGIVYFDDFAYFDMKGNYAPSETILCNAGEKASTQYLHNYKLHYKDFLPLSPCCNTPLRPNIVWFGEIPFHMAKIDKLVKEADIFISIGTSGQVYPAAGFLQTAKAAGAFTVCINKESIPQTAYIDHFISGLASVEVPKFLESLT